MVSLSLGGRWSRSIALSTLLLLGSSSAISLSIAPMATAQSPAQFREAADALERRGIEQIQAGDIEAGLQSWQQALAIYRQLGDRQQEGRLLTNFGSLFIQLEAYPQAEQALQASLEIARELNDPAARGSIFLLLGRVALETGDLGQAEVYHRQAADFSLAIEDRETALVALGTLGSLAYDRQDYSTAIAHYNQALFLAFALEDLPRIRLVSKNLGDAYYFVRNCQYAAALYEVSAATARELEDNEALASALQNRGNAAYCQGELDTALAAYQESLEIVRTLGDRQGEARLQGNIGLVYVELGEYDRAIPLIEQDLESARTSGDRQAEGQALGFLGRANYGQENYQQALESYQQSLAIAREVNYTRGIGLMLSNIGGTLRQLERYPEAEESLQEALTVYARLRETAGVRDEELVSIFEFHIRTYRLLQGVQVAQGKNNAALEIAEAGRVRALVELLASNPSLEEKISPEPPDLEAIRRIAVEQEATLVQYSLIYNEDRDRDEDLELYIWVISPQGEIDFASIDLDERGISLEELVGNSREELGVGDRGTSQRGGEPGQLPQLRQLHQLLIEPIAEYLPTEAGARVVFIPQEELFLVPFPALQASDNSYLVERYAIMTSPSIQVLDITRRQRESLRQTGSQPLVVGNPIMPEVRLGPEIPPQPLSPLPGTEAEAQEIASLLNTQPLIGEEATEVSVVRKMVDAPIIHLATHGLLDISPEGVLDSNVVSYRGLGGAIALAPSEGENGLLLVEEILDLQLNASLVVLSACDTGRGRITGDGVLGLSRAFLLAGTPSLVVSLWAVPDDPTQELMVEFYRQMEQNPDRARALQQAMLTVKERHPHPLNWAAFTIIGEAE